MQYSPLLRPFPLAPNELERLSALYAYNILDTEPEPSFDRIVAMASRAFKAPIALVSLVDNQRQWFKAKCGLNAVETERDLSFCTHAMLEQQPMVVCDATQDNRFSDNALVTGPPGIRFYVGAPIKTKDGLPLGSLCVIDTVPRHYPEQDLLDSLTDLAALVVEQLESRSSAAGKVRAEKLEQLNRSNAALLAEIKAHELTQTVLVGQNQILRKIAEGCPIKQIFDELLDFGESESNGYVGLLFLKNEGGETLRFAAGPKVADEVRTALSSVNIGPNGSPAGAAAYLGERVIRHVSVGPNWPAAELLQRHGVTDVSAAPILGRHNQVLGAISFAFRGEYTEHHILILEACASLATVALQRDEEQATLRLSETAVRESEHRLQVGLGLAGVAVWTWSTKDDTVSWSGPVKQIFGVDPGNFRSYASLRELMPPEDREIIDSKIADSVRDGRDYDGEFRIVRPDGAVRWIAGMGGVTLNDQGEVVQMSGVNFDITDRKLAEEKLALSELHFRELAESMPQIVWTANAVDDFEYRNRRWFRHTGLPAENVSRQAWQEILHPDDAALWQAALVEAHQARIPCEMEFRLWDITQQQYRWHLGRKQPILNDSGEVVRWYGTCIDIHERKDEEIKLTESEQSLRKRDEQLAMLFETGSMGDFAWDFAKAQVTAHRTVWALYGYPGRVGKGPVSAFSVRFHPDEAEMMAEKLNGAIAGKWPRHFEHRVLWPDGTVHWVASRGVAIRDQAGKPIGLHGIIFDITERKNSELRMQESERQLREQADAMPLVVWRSKPDGQIDYCNARWQDYTGYSVELTQAMGWSSIVHPDDLPRCAVESACGFESQTSFALEFRARRADGAYRWLMAQCFPFRDNEGRLLRWFGAGIDIHDQKTMNDRLEEQVLSRTSELQHSLLMVEAKENALLRSLAEKETLLKEVHHRVKNNLQVISSLLSIQEHSLPDGPAAAALKDSQQRVVSMSLIHESLYGGTELDEIDFGEYARTLVNELFISFSERSVNLSSRFNTSSVRLNIEQAVPCGLILNELVTNSLKYAYPNNEAGEILIELKETESGQVSLIVSDRGVGLPEGFDRRESKSMGLPIADLLAKQIGGTLSVLSPPGSTFILEFPRQLNKVKTASAG